MKLYENDGFLWKKDHNNTHCLKREFCNLHFSKCIVLKWKVSYLFLKVWQVAANYDFK